MTFLNIKCLQQNVKFKSLTYANNKNFKFFINKFDVTVGVYNIVYKPQIFHTWIFLHFKLFIFHSISLLRAYVSTANKHTQHNSTTLNISTDL